MDCVKSVQEQQHFVLTASKTILVSISITMRVTVKQTMGTIFGLILAHPPKRTACPATDFVKSATGAHEMTAMNAEM